MAVGEKGVWVIRSPTYCQCFLVAGLFRPENSGARAHFDSNPLGAAVADSLHVQQNITTSCLFTGALPGMDHLRNGAELCDCLSELDVVPAE